MKYLFQLYLLQSLILLKTLMIIENNIMKKIKNIEIKSLIVSMVGNLHEHIKHDLKNLNYIKNF